MLERIKKHLTDHKREYITGAVCLVVGGVVVYVWNNWEDFVENVDKVEVDNSAQVVQGIAVNSPVSITNITQVTRESLTDPGNVWKDLATGEEWNSSNLLAKAEGVSRGVLKGKTIGDIIEWADKKYQLIQKAEFATE